MFLLGYFYYMYDIIALFLPFLPVIVFFPGISIFIYAWRLLVLYYCVNTEKKKKTRIRYVKCKDWSANVSYISCEISMINAKLTSFCVHRNKTISNLNYREEKHLESLQENTSFLKKELLMKNEIIKSLTETQTVVLDTILTSQRMLTADKNSLDAPETPRNTTSATHNQQLQQE